MTFNKKFIKHSIKNITSLFNITNLFLFVVFIIALFYFFNNKITLIEANQKLKDKGNDEEGAKNIAKNSYTISDQILPSSEHVTEGNKVK
tara:strand:- start:8257 stop:8526 length:270 start_codon:yes stop_codon:yes gene_type:complete